MLQRQQNNIDRPNIPFRMENEFPEAPVFQAGRAVNVMRNRMRDNFQELTDMIGVDSADELTHSDTIPINNIPIGFEIMNNSVDGFTFYIQINQGSDHVNIYWQFNEDGLENEYVVPVADNVIFLRNIAEEVLANAR